MGKKSRSGALVRTDAVDLLLEFLLQMHGEGRVAYVDESSNRVFRQVDVHFVEVTTSNAHAFPEAAVWIPIVAK